MKSIKCATYEGLDAKVVDVEVTLTKGLPSFSIIGANASIEKSREKIKSALLSSEYKFPPKRISTLLAPSDLVKNGSQFDLAIALLIALGELDVDLQEWFVFGELGLDGSVKESQQIYPLMLSLANQSLVQKAIVPFEALEKLSKIPDVSLYGVKSLGEAVELIQNQSVAQPYNSSQTEQYPFYEIDGEKFYYLKEYDEDFLDVKGQEIAKRAALISAAGFHNIILEGSPGCGKSMIASRLRYILPAMKMDEILDKAKIQALESREVEFKPRRGMTTTHCSATPASVLGGGSGAQAKIGDVSIANNGILFFDELPHFSKSILEALREPMQDNQIRISRVSQKSTYAANFLFVGAMNPCPCGNLLNQDKECRCNELEIQKYKNRLSDPFLDRVDLHVVMQNVSISDKPSLSSKEMHKMVLEANIFAKRRGQKSLNAKMSDIEIEQFCKLHDDAKAVLDMATQNFALSFRSIKKVQKVARTIADLEANEMIEKRHILEALSYRRR
jgi:magnesium chelatase family protein